MESATNSGPETAPSGSRAGFWLGSIAAIGLPALLFLATRYPGPGGRINVGDSAKFQYIGEILGVPHEPGYPQYVVLNFLWTRLPLPMQLADKVNLLSTVFGLIAGVFLFAALHRLTHRPGIAVLGTWTMLLTRSVWIFCTEAEVYALHLLWVTALLWAVVHLLTCPSPMRFRWMVTAMTILAFSFGNHPTAILLVPGLAVVMLGLDRRLALSPRVLAVAACIAVLAISQYGFVMWRSHTDTPFLEGIGKEASLGDLIGKVSGARFSTKHVMKQGSQGSVRRAVRAAVELPRQLTWPTLVLAVYGAAALYPGRRLLLAYLLIGVMGPPLFVVFYQIGDWQAYLAPAFVSLAALAAIGLTEIGHHRRKIQIAASVIWLLALGWTTVSNYPAVKVDDNPRDRSRLLAAAKSGDWVVTYPLNGYSFRQLNNYYRYGLRVEERKQIRLRTAPEVFEQEWAFLTDDRLLFATQDVRDVFDAYRTDYVPLWTGDGESSPLAASGTRFPTQSIRLQPRDDGLVSLIGPDELELVGPAPAIQFLVASPGEKRIKGVTSFPARRVMTRYSRWPLRDFLGRVQAGDWVCVVVQGSALTRDGEGTRLILDKFGVHPSVLPESPTALVLAGVMGSPVDSFEILVDPVAPIDLRLPPAR